MPKSTIAPGAINVEIRKAATGKIIFSRLETLRGGFIRISRSSRGRQQLHDRRLNDGHERHV